MTQDDFLDASLHAHIVVATRSLEANRNHTSESQSHGPHSMLQLTPLKAITILGVPDAMRPSRASKLAVLPLWLHPDPHPAKELRDAHVCMVCF